MPSKLSPSPRLKVWWKEKAALDTGAVKNLPPNSGANPPKLI